MMGFLQTTSLLWLTEMCALVLGIGAGCGWDATWHDVTTPSAANNFTDFELGINQTQLANLCNAPTGRMLARCKDSKGEPFSYNKSETILHYTASCEPVSGLRCKPVPGFNASCPDFAIQFGCECATTTTSTTARVTTKGTSTTLRLGAAAENQLGCGNSCPDVKMSAWNVLLMLLCGTWLYKYTVV